MSKKIKLAGKSRSKIDLFGKMLELPPGLLGKGSHIELMSNTEAVVDGCRGVLEYDDTVVKLNTGKMIVTFTGRNLIIAAFDREQAVIKGYILSLSFGLI